MAREALADDAVVKKITENFIPVLIDFDAEEPWAKGRGVTNLPIIQWTDSTGETMAFTEDVKPVAQVLEDMQDALDFIAEFDSE
jgi:hypothetical protein